MQTIASLATSSATMPLISPIKTLYFFVVAPETDGFWIDLLP